ncbi:MAG: hypothetical protein ACXVZ2_05835 [Gaiellaceae bacterium]
MFAAAALVLALVLPGHASASCKTIVVTKAAVSYPHATTIQAGVNRAKPCDWVLVAPGRYPENVVIRTPHLHLRGMNRNTVIVDGAHRVGQGIVVDRANDVWIENLTVRNWDRKSRDDGDSGGNEIWFNGGDETGKIGASGWHGNWLTAYDTGLLGGYGIFTSNSVNGEFDHVYASGFNDSGVYIGACPDCQATVSHALVERNALGFSGTNAGGHLIVQDSVFRNNAVGVGPNSLPNDIPPPQLGTCNSATNTSPTPTITTTKLDRCTIFRRNTITNNNNLTTPANGTSGQLPWGVGLEPVGTYGDLFTDNTISGNRNFGILGVENPVPFPPTADTIYFQLAGNAFTNNKVSGGGYADIALAGGLFGAKQSVDNCFANNVYKTSMPADLSPWSCSLDQTPNPDPAAAGQLLGIVIKLQGESMARKAKGQPAPPAQPTMPRPCAGAPKNPLCK